MIIKSTYLSKRTGKEEEVHYHESTHFDDVQDSAVGAIGAFCFYKEKLVLVYADKRQSWEIPGGGREEGETFEECIVREIKEESNMKVLKLVPIGYDAFINKETGENWYVLRYAAQVEPYGDFVVDGAEDGEITDIKLINPEDYKQYFDWGKRSDVMMEKALQIIT